MCFAPQRRALFRHRRTPSNRQKVARTPCGNFNMFHQNVLGATTACTCSTSQLPKVVCGNLYIFTSKCASRHNSVHFFDISTLQKWLGAEMFCTLFTSKCASRHNGVHFFHISTSKSRPKMVCFVHFYFQMCFASTTACTFSTSQLPKVAPS